MTRTIGRRDALKTMVAAGALAVVGGGARLSAGSGDGETVAVPEAIPGDGTTPVADALQRFLYRLAENGGGTAVLPPGRYLLEKTLLIPSGVNLIGHGVATVLTGDRPDGVRGFALLANDGIVTERGYEGARHFSVQNLAIDSPRTNGIVLVHASDAYFSTIFGLDAFHHHFDIAGSRNIVTENIFLTGRSGTAPYQIDGSPFNNNIWDGEQQVAPIRDDTPNDGIFLSNSVIRPVNRPNHGIHLHRRGGRNIYIDNVLIEHVENGIYRDRNCSREDLFVSNVSIRDVAGRAVHFEPSTRQDQRVTFDNITIAGCRGAPAVDYHACEELVLKNLKIDAGEAGGSMALADVTGGTLSDLSSRGRGEGVALFLRGCRNLFLARTSVRAFPVALALEDCANIQYSGLMALDEGGEPIEAQISGRECLARWEKS